MRERQMDLGLCIHVGSPFDCELEQKMRDPACDGAGKRQTAGIAQDGTVLLADAFCGVQASFYMPLDEMKKVALLKGLYLGVLDSLRGDFIRRLRERRAQAEHVAWLRDLHQ